MRARLAVRGTAKRPLLGLFKTGTHKVVSIPECRIHHPRLNDAAQLVLSAVKELGVRPLDEATGQGDLRYVQLTALHSSCLQSPVGPTAQLRAEADPAAVVQVVLVWQGQRKLQRRQQRELASLLQRKDAKQAGEAGQPALLHSVWVNAHSGQGNAILDTSHWQHLCGSTESWQRFGLADVCLPPQAFAQANFGAMDAALAAMLPWVLPGSRVVDLHAGVGTIGLSVLASGRASSMTCVEVNPGAEAAFQKSLTRLQQGTGHSEEEQQATSPAAGQQGLLQASFATADVTWAPEKWLSGAQVAIVDPPRKGLGPELLGALCKADLSPEPHAESGAEPQSLKRLVYLSCGWRALVHDLDTLLGSGVWRLVHAQAWVFFPGTDSLETLVILDRVR